MKISVIVPVYNSEKYLQKCIDSLLEQDLDEVQFIFVNDGSKDRSGEILNIYKDDDRFTIINQDNMGQGAARNTALDIAIGEYIVFLDSDDYLEKNVLRNMYYQAKNNSLDILRAYFVLDDFGKKIDPKYLCEEGIVQSGRDYLRDGLVSYSLCEHMYRRELLNEHKIRMMNKVRYEDMDFVIRAVYFAKKMMILNMPFFTYVRREGSVSNGNDFSIVTDYYKVALKVSTFVYENSDELTYENYFREYLGFLFSHVINLCITNEFDVNKLIEDNIVKENILRHLRKSGVKRYYIQYLLIKMNLYGIYKLAYKKGKDI